MLASGDLSLSTRIVEALQELHDMRFGALFLPFIVDREPAIRSAAARTVATFGMAEALIVLKPLVTMGDEKMRLAAVQAVGCMRVAGGKELLEQRLRVESNVDVRSAIMELVNNWE